MLMVSDDFSRGIAQAIGDAVQKMSAAELRQLAVGPYLDIRATVTARNAVSV